MKIGHQGHILFKGRDVMQVDFETKRDMLFPKIWILFLLFLREGECGSFLIRAHISFVVFCRRGVWLIFHTCPHILFEGGNCSSFFILVHTFFQLIIFI